MDLYLIINPLGRWSRALFWDFYYYNIEIFLAIYGMVIHSFGNFRLQQESENYFYLRNQNSLSFHHKQKKPTLVALLGPSGITCIDT